MLVRVVRGDSETLFLSAPSAFNDFNVNQLRGLGGLEQVLSESGTARLEVATTRLADGTLLQVGKSSENREALLARFRAVLAIVSVVIVALGLAGGAIVTRSTLQPIRRLITAVRGIIRTGRIDARVPVRTERDAIDELSGLFNEMLDRITTLIRGMEHALDNVAHDLRTPMTRLRGVAERALQSDDVQVQREALVTSLEESERILAMLDTLMDISEAETGTMRLDISDVAVGAIVAEVVELYENVCGRQAHRGLDGGRGGSDSASRFQASPSGPGQPARQRHQIHAGRWAGYRERPARGSGRASSTSRIPASASRRTTSRTSGIASIEVTRVAPSVVWGWV